MKVRFKHRVTGLTGKLDGLVYFYNQQLDVIVARKHTIPAHNPSALRMKEVMENMKLINPSEGYRQNFRDYLILYNAQPEGREHPVCNWTNLYLKMMYAMAKKIPGIDLATLTREQIYLQELPCLCLKDAIEAGLLPAVRNYTGFIRGI